MFKVLLVVAIWFAVAKTGFSYLHFTVKDIDGNDVSLMDYHKKCVLVVVTSSSAFDAKEQMEWLNKTASKYSRLTVLAFPATDYGQEGEKLNGTELKKWFNDWNPNFKVFAPVKAHSFELFEHFLIDEPTKRVKPLADIFGKFLITHAGGKIMGFRGWQEVMEANSSSLLKDPISVKLSSFCGALTKRKSG